MSSPKEPEKYSIDEMLERLQQRPPAEEPLSDGELVTRADGSQAIKVRKRKRRTRQPHKEELLQARRSRMIQISVVTFLLLGITFGCGMAFIYANSAPFRDDTVRKISAKTGALVDISQFRMTPTRANAGQLSFSWPEGNVLKNLSLRNVSAAISPSSFFGKSMTGEEITSVESTLILRTPVTDQPKQVAMTGGAEDHVNFNAFSTPNLHLCFGDPTTAVAQIQKTEASMLVHNGKGLPQLLLNRGELTMAGCPKLNLDRAHLEFRGPEIDLLGMRLRVGDDSLGSLEFAGTLSPYASSTNSRLAVDAQAFPIEGITGPDWGRIFKGRIDSKPPAKSNFMIIRSGSDPMILLELPFTRSLASSFDVSGLPFLIDLGKLLDDNWFETPEFESEACGVIRRENAEVTFEQLNLVSKGRMAIKGHMRMGADQKLSGELQVGLAEGMIITSKNPKLNAMFSPTEDGFRWLTITVSGLASAPADNFSKLYKSADLPADATTVPSFEHLTAPR